MSGIRAEGPIIAASPKRTIQAGDGRAPAAAATPAQSQAVVAAPQPRRTRLLGWIAPIGGGLAGALAFDPFGLAFLIPLFPLGIFIGLRTAPRPRSAFLRTIAGGFTYYMIAISWLLTLGRFYPIVMGGIVIAALYLTLYTALPAYVMRRWFAGLSPMRQFLGFAALWVVAEWARTLGELAVPMVQLGHAVAPWPSLVQSAEILGEAGLNAQVLLIAGAALAILCAAAGARGLSPAPADELPGAADLLLGSPSKSGPRWMLACALAGLSALLMAGSAYRFHLWSMRIDAEERAPALRVMLVQPNIRQEEKIRSVVEEDEDIRFGLVEEHTRILEDLVSAEVDTSIDLVVFPESAYTDLLFSVYSENRERVRRMMEASGADLLTGATRVGLNEAMTHIEEVWNSAWFIPAEGAWESYDKIRLVPFGENLSYFRYLPFIGTLVAVGEFDRGREMSVFRTDGIPFSTIICFESYFGAQTRLAAREGAEFIVLITNDGWYGRSAGPYQHHAQSVLRSVETRRPLLRAAYTGISSIFDPAGRLTASLGLENRGVVHGEIRPESEMTFFVRWGNVWLIGASTLTLLGLHTFANRRRALS